MLRVLVICGSTRGRGGYVPTALLKSFLGLVRLRKQDRCPLEIVLHEDSPLAQEESAEDFCTIRPWPEIRAMFAEKPPCSADIVIMFEHKEGGAAFAELADVIQRVRDKARPPFIVLFVSDSRKNEEDARVAWLPEVSDDLGFTVITCYDDGTGNLPISVFVTALVDAVGILLSLQPTG